jgi:hypothetical protein
MANLNEIIFDRSALYHLALPKIYTISRREDYAKNLQIIDAITYLKNVVF